MTGPEELLLVADRRVSEELAGRVRPGRFVSCPDPYDALVQMQRRSWRGVVLTAPRADLAGLCRALRRLQRSARLFALCPPAAEPDVCPLAGKVLDDYFIYPPTGAELGRMLAAVSQLSLASGSAPSSAGVLSLDEYGEMVDAACSIGSLEAKVAAMVSRRLGAAARWTDAEQLAPGAEILLLSNGDISRALVAENYLGTWDRSAGGFVSALEQCLPGLMKAAGRTEALHRLATTDHLTGAYNRRYFYYRTNRILAQAEREGFRVTLLLYDIDDFKHYNDTYGHAAGDEILRETVALMKQATRAQDVVARIGGDEFAVLFWDPNPPRSPDSSPPKTAYILADRFRRAVIRHRFSAVGPEASGALTISGGLAAFPGGGTTCRALLRTADRALKGAKRTGKNAIRLVGPG